MTPNHALDLMSLLERERIWEATRKSHATALFVALCQEAEVAA